MKKKIRTDRRFFMFVVLGILFSGIWLRTAGITARAEGTAFAISAEMLSSDDETYDIRLTVRNSGEDWEGTARLVPDATGNVPYLTDDGYESVYDTVLSLPQGSTKQFVVRVPKESVERTDESVRVILLDKKSNVTAKKDFARLLQGEADALFMGILSDNYPSLTYLDMGGNELDYQGSYFPIKLVELNQDNLSASLDTLNYLVIDSYNTSVLTEGQSQGIEEWMENGGVLIVGTGSHAEDVLSGLGYLRLQCDKVEEPEASENMEASQDMKASEESEQNRDDTYKGGAHEILSQLHRADLNDLDDMYQENYSVYDSSVLTCPWGAGGVGVLPYALSELGSLAPDAYRYTTKSSFVENILDIVNDNAYFHGRGRHSYDTRNTFRRMLSVFGNGNSHLRFGGLKLIVLAYVVFVGPVLYLILRFAGKRDFYWIAVPVTACVGIFLVYWAGRGFEVVNTRMYSVTMENLADRGKVKTYMRCYDAGHGEWELCLAEEYEYAGPQAELYHGHNENDSYFYRIQKEGDRLCLGINPDKSFEDSYFVAGGNREPESGGISGEIRIRDTDVSGTVFNGTEWDFKYYAVITDDGRLYIYKNLPAGGSADLATAEKEYGSAGVSDPAYDYLYNYMRNEMEDKNRDIDMMAALGMGIYTACYQKRQDTTVMIGVTENWHKAADDNCSETSYGCLYAVQ